MELGFDLLGGVRCIVTKSPIQLQNRVNPALEGALGDAVLFVFATPKFAFDLNVTAFLQIGREFTKFAEGYAGMPFGAGFPVAVVVLP